MRVHRGFVVVGKDIWKRACLTFRPTLSNNWKCENESFDAELFSIRNLSLFLCFFDSFNGSESLAIFFEVGRKCALGNVPRCCHMSFYCGTSTILRLTEKFSCDERKAQQSISNPTAIMNSYPSRPNMTTKY